MKKLLLMGTILAYSFATATATDVKPYEPSNKINPQYINFYNENNGKTIEYKQAGNGAMITEDGLKYNNFKKKKPKR
jgi:hypothetical protein